MRCLVLMALLGMVMADTNLEGAWSMYKMEHGKEYSDHQEDRMRFELWQKTSIYIDEFNAGNHGFQLGMNHFGDMTDDEYLQHLGSRSIAKRNSSGDVFEKTMDPKDLPGNVDWRSKGYVTPIKNQGACGSCWAFSTTGSVEGQHFKKTGKLVSLSEQNLVDCSAKQGNYGCRGGLMDHAFTYIKENGGIDTEASYAYTAVTGQCKYNSANIGATVTGHMDVHKYDEQALMQAAATVGPISVAIDAASKLFRYYKSGVFYNPSCSQYALDHGVLVVGYGEEKESGLTYWLVKNSWGTTWGEQGYIKMSRNRQNNCGIASSASYPLV